jgi:hypothetical protein
MGHQAFLSNDIPVRRPAEGLRFEGFENIALFGFVLPKLADREIDAALARELDGLGAPGISDRYQGEAS